MLAIDTRFDIAVRVANGIQIFGRPNEKKTIRLDRIVQFVDYDLLYYIVKIDQHVSAKNHIEQLLRR